MILLGIMGGTQQGKSTVGDELRRLAGVDSKAGLESNYPIGEVTTAWVEQWPLSVLESGLPVIDIANKLIPLIADPVKKVSGLEVDVSKLLIQDTSDSRTLNNRLLSYLERYIEAGTQRSEEFPLPMNPENRILHRQAYQWVGARLIDEVDAGPNQDIWVHVLDKRVDTLMERNYSLLTVTGLRYPIQLAWIRRRGGLIINVERPGATVDNDATEQARLTETPDINIVNNGTLEQLNAVVDTLYNDLLAGKTKSKYAAV